MGMVADNKLAGVSFKRFCQKNFMTLSTSFLRLLKILTA